MDAHRFDALLRNVADSLSRRAILGLGLCGTSAALGTPLLGARNRKAKCKKCGPCKKCKNGKCMPKANGRNCGGGKECRNGACRCPEGTEACGGNCVDRCSLEGTERNPLSCGCCFSNGQSLGIVCPTFNVCCSENCISGTCVALEQGEPCDLDAQCESRNCDSGACAA